MVMTKGGIIFSEITEQPSLWQQTIKVYNKERETLIWIKKMQFNQIIFMGEGDSFYTAMIGAEFFKSIGKRSAAAIHPSDVYSEDILPFHPKLRTLVVAISRSGEEDEMIWAAEHVKKKKPDTQILSLTNNSGSGLQEKSDRSIIMEYAMDEGVIPISSFSSNCYMLALMAGALGGNAKFLGELSKIPKEIDIRGYHDVIMRMRKLKEIKTAIYAGISSNRGLAGYGSLTAQEMSLTSSQYINSLELRHNNYLGNNQNSMILFILSDRLKDMEVASMRDAAKTHSQIFLLTEEVDPMVEAAVEYSIKLESGLSTAARTFYYIPILQLISFQMAISRGRNPDKPVNCIDVVKYKKKPESILG